MKRPPPNRIRVFAALLFPVMLTMGLLFAMGMIGCRATPSVARAWGEGMTMDQAVSKIAKSLVEQGALQGQPVLISTHDFYDRTSGLGLPLASLLREKMVTAMRRQGARVMLPGGDEDRLLILQGTWQRQKDALSLDMKVMKLTPEGPEAVSAESAVISPGEIDPADLTPDLESWGRYLVRKLETNPVDQKVRTVHIRNIHIGRKDGVTVDHDGYFSGWLRAALTDSRLFRPLDQQRAMEKVSVDAIRHRAIAVEAVQTVVSSTGLTADILQAESELSGSAWLHEKAGVIQIRLSIKETRGPDISSALADIPFSLLPDAVLYPPKRPVVPPTPPGTADSAGRLSSNGLTVDLTTTRGENRPFYKAGEEIRFVVRLNRTAHLYLFCLQPDAKATLLHPVEPDGRLFQGAHPILGAGKPLVIPDDTASYRLVVREPFGTETVLAVASGKRLDLPDRLTGNWADAMELIGRIRRQAISGANGYAEAQVELVTGR